MDNAMIELIDKVPIYLRDADKLIALMWLNAAVKQKIIYECEIYATVESKYIQCYTKQWCDILTRIWFMWSTMILKTVRMSSISCRISLEKHIVTHYVVMMIVMMMVMMMMLLLLMMMMMVLLMAVVVVVAMLMMILMMMTILMMTTMMTMTILFYLISNIFIQGVPFSRTIIPWGPVWYNHIIVCT